MKKLAVKNIDLLVGMGHEEKLYLKGKRMTELSTLLNVYLIIENGHFADYDKMSGCPPAPGNEKIVNVEGGAILLLWYDSHTRIIFAGNRKQEFVDKICRLGYVEIAKRGGGILNSANRLHKTSEENLYQQVMKRIDETIRKGVGCAGIKSGYGLNTEDELKMPCVVRRIKEMTQLKVVATFLGAHAISREHKDRQDACVDLIINEMIPVVGAEKLAGSIDVSRDTGFFTPEGTAYILKAGAEYGMRPKVHADELESPGGVEVDVEYNAPSADHLENMIEEEIKILKSSKAVPTAFPGTFFFLDLSFTLGRKMIGRGSSLTLASDYSPGSIPSGDMKFTISLACTGIRLMPAEVANAAILNGACAAGSSKGHGSIIRRKVASFFITDTIPSIEFIPYVYAVPIVKRVFLQGEEYVQVDLMTHHNKSGLHQQHIARQLGLNGILVERGRTSHYDGSCEMWSDRVDPWIIRYTEGKED